MIITTKIQKILPNCELGEIRPCLTKGKVQFHLLVVGRKDPMTRALNLRKLETLMAKDKRFSDIRSSEELGVIKASYKGAEMSILASGRVVVRKANDESHAKELLEALAPMLKASLIK